MNRVFQVVFYAILAIAPVWCVYILGTQSKREFQALVRLVAQRNAESMAEAQKQTAEAREKVKVESAKTKANVKLLLESLYGHPCMLGVTMEAYGLLGQGMNNGEVRSIIGDDGIEQSSIGDIITRCWQDGNKAIVVTFQDGRLVGKSQVGL